MKLLPPLMAAAALLALAPSGALAQQAISARAGLINVADGDVFLADARSGSLKPFERRPTELVELKEGQTLETQEGRAELLLTPGAFLRIGESSAVRMQSSRLDAVRVELLKGVALADVVELLREHSLTLLVGDTEVSIHKAGLYRLQATPVRIRVFNGQAEVRAGGQAWTLKGGRELSAANGGWVAAKFDQGKGTDALYRWSKRRAGYIAMANVSAARQAGLMSSSFTGGRWFWNPYFGFATYIPWSEYVRSPFGYYYYTPSTVQYVYFPPQRGPGSGVAPDRGAFGAGLPGSLPRRSAAGSTYTPSAPVSASAPVGGTVGAGSLGTRSGGAVGGGGVIGGGAAAAPPARGGRGQ
ncbi:MAG: hypothetical protein KatS3mg004_3452 [Bryobacteraceae bacterium]|nr:MAG: hypothetical protein KatS3mg004_3452 [Bryobacteraceae bacterium]